MAQPPVGPEGPGRPDAPWTGPGPAPRYPSGPQHHPGAQQPGSQQPGSQQPGPQYPPGPQPGPQYPPGPQRPSAPQHPTAPAPSAPHRPSNGFGPYGPGYGRPSSAGGGGSQGGSPPWGRPPAGGPPTGPGGPRRMGPLARALLIGAGALALVVVIFAVSAVVVARHHAAEAYREATQPPATEAPAGTPTPPTPTPTASSPSASSTPRDPTNSATRSASSSATTAAAEPRPTYHYTTNTARASRLYNVVFAAGSKGCKGIPLYRPPIPNAQLQAYAQRIVNCLVQINKGPLAKQGLKLTTPKVKTYHTGIDTPCGYLPLRKYPAWYCSKNITIYLNATTDDSNYGYYSADLGYWYILSHEFGHHLQHVGGIFGDYMEQRAQAGPQTRNELSRRLELQATCFSGVFLNASYASLKMTKADFDQYTWFLANYGDEETGTHDHGSGANNVYWLERGYAGQWSSYGDCNTWTARAGRVS